MCIENIPKGTNRHMIRVNGEDTALIELVGNPIEGAKIIRQIIMAPAIIKKLQALNDLVKNSVDLFGEMRTAAIKATEENEQLLKGLQS